MYLERSIIYCILRSSLWKLIFQYVVRRKRHCMKTVQIWSFFWSVFFCIRTRKNSVFGHFSRSEDRVLRGNVFSQFISGLKLLILSRSFSKKRFISIMNGGNVCLQCYVKCMHNMMYLLMLVTCFAIAVFLP